MTVSQLIFIILGSQWMSAIVFGLMFSIFMRHTNKKSDEIFLAYLLEKHKGDLKGFDEKRLKDYNVKIIKKDDKG